MHDPILGDVTEREDELSCSVLVSGEQIQLLVRLEGATPQEGLTTARSLLSALPQLLPRAWEELVAAFLPLVNGGYLDEGEAPLGREDFLGRAALSGVSTDADGNVSFHFSDGDMLWGHWMTVHCTLDGSAWHSEMSG